MQKRWVLFGLGLALGCEHPYSNEDLLFRASLPGREQVTISVPSGSQATDPPNQALFYRQAKETSEQLNAAIFQPLAIVEEITRSPPSRRESDLRVWGPIIDGETEYLLAVTRTATRGARAITSSATVVPVNERFDYALFGEREGESVTVFGGSFAPLNAEGEGVGEVFADAEAARRVNPAEAGTGRYFGGFFFQGGALSLALLYQAPEAPGGEPDRASAACRFDHAPGGITELKLSYRTDLDSIEGGPPVSALESVGLRARWLPDLRGRADFYFGEGDLVAPLEGVECWDSHLERVYFSASGPGLGGPSGLLAACPTELHP